MSVSSSGNLQKTVYSLRTRYGDTSWWPGDRDEVLIGAILTRQTRWEKVTRARAELRSREAHAPIGEYAKEFCIKKRCAPCILVNSSG